MVLTCFTYFSKDSGYTDQVEHQIYSITISLNDLVSKKDPSRFKPCNNLKLHNFTVEDSQFLNYWINNGAMVTLQTTQW